MVSSRRLNENGTVYDKKRGHAAAAPPYKKNSPPPPESLETSKYFNLSQNERSSRENHCTTKNPHKTPLRMYFVYYARHTYTSPDLRQARPPLPPARRQHSRKEVSSPLLVCLIRPPRQRVYNNSMILGVLLLSVQIPFVRYLYFVRFFYPLLFGSHETERLPTTG